jgi:hypothetical protein
MVRSVRAHPDPDCWAAVLLLVMATLSLQPGNALVIRICRANKEHHLVAHYEFPMSLPYHMRTGRPHDTRSQGYIVAAMLVAANAGMMQSHVEKRWRNLNWPVMIILSAGLSTTNNRYRSGRPNWIGTERAGSLPPHHTAHRHRGPHRHHRAWRPAP